MKIMSEKYLALLNYFGEDTNINSQEFFSTLNNFVRDFITTRELVERLYKAEERKRLLEEAAKKKAIEAAIKSTNNIDNKIATGPIPPQIILPTTNITNNNTGLGSGDKKKKRRGSAFV